MTRLPAERRFVRVWNAALAMVLTAAVPAICVEQAAAASTLKAAFMLNFVKFTEWPDLKPGLPIRVCVSSEDAIAEAMTQTLGGQLVNGRAIQVARIAPDDAVGDCQLLFVTEREPRRLAALLNGTSQVQMLTISDVAESAQHGAVIEFFMESDHLRFAINIDTMERSRLKISSRLLSLAKIVRSANSR